MAATAVTPHGHRRRRIVLIVVAGVLVVLIVGVFVAAEVTAKSTFCVNCHEMDPYYTSWQESTHQTTQCTQCHVPPGFVHFVATKAYALREVWIHFTGQVKAPLAVTRAIPNSSCFRCHDVGTVEGGCAFCHTPPHEPRGTCADCHNLQSWTGAIPTSHPFKLTDTHATLACTACHKADSSLGLIPGTSLGKASADCSFCHKTPHVSPTDCQRCHTPKAWKPPDFTHPQVGEHMPRGEVSVPCADCHPDGFATSTCAKCHDGTPGDD